MSSYHAVTSFSPRLWKVYGKRFVDSFLRFWDIPLIVYAESQPRPDIDCDRLYWLNLDDMVARRQFLERNRGKDHPRDYSEQVTRFCHKVFAITDVSFGGKWRIWLDADITTFAHVNEDDLRDYCPEDCALSYLGRDGWMMPGWKMHSECGFVAYNLHDSRTRQMLDRMREIYVTDEVLRLGPHMQHDSAVFDVAREEAGFTAQEVRNLSAGLKGLDVFERTALGQRMRHHKGVRRKIQAYGTA